MCMLLRKLSQGMQEGMDLKQVKSYVSLKLAILAEAGGLFYV